MKTWASEPQLRKLQKWLESFSERWDSWRHDSCWTVSQWDLVIINQKTKNKSERQTMQLLSYKNLSRNLASRVAERLFISWLCDSAWGDDSWQRWKLNIRPCRLWCSWVVFLIRRRTNIHNSNPIILGRIEMVSLGSIVAPFKIMLIHWDSDS